jgi:hypothetical protein
MYSVGISFDWGSFLVDIISIVDIGKAGECHNKNTFSAEISDV